jgi:hypothetical protein
MSVTRNHISLFILLVCTFKSRKCVIIPDLFEVLSVTFFLLTVRITDYHWDRHLYFVIHSHHAQTMTHTPPSDDSILILLLVVLAACDSN